MDIIIIDQNIIIMDINIEGEEVIEEVTTKITIIRKKIITTMIKMKIQLIQMSKKKKKNLILKVSIN